MILRILTDICRHRPHRHRRRCAHRCHRRVSLSHTYYIRNTPVNEHMFVSHASHTCLAARLCSRPARS